MSAANPKKLLRALPGRNNPCLHCPPILPALKLNARIAVGFGMAGVTKNGEMVWCEDADHDFEDCWTVREAEKLARKSPRADWRIVMHGPLHGETYQRQGKNRWVLVEKNEGFA